MFVRTRPRDGTRVVVTKAGADLVDEEWAIANGTHGALLAKRKEIEIETEALRKEFPGVEPTEHEVEWRILDRELNDHAKNDDWGLYRNTLFARGELLRRELRSEQALVLYLEVCYLDLNGPRNLGGLRNSKLWRECMPFHPGDGFLAPGITKRTRRLADALQLDESALGTLFVEHNIRVREKMRLPLSPSDCWPVLRRSLYQDTS